MKNVLFISYDGMTDPLGQSQVLPYLVGLSGKGYRFTILSCEKEGRFAKEKATIEEITKKHEIEWCPLQFTSFPPVLAKYYDLYNLERKAFDLHQKKKFDLVHCRSYVSAAIGLKLKQKFGVKLLFDMRGFWVDERVDGGAWNLKNPFYKLAYQIYKRKEAAYIGNADAIISLTEAGKQEIESWSSYKQAPIQVIPCSTDFDLFALVSPEQKTESRRILGIREASLVVSYLGSVGAWYMLDEMLALFNQIKRAYPGATFLFVTPEPAAMILEAAQKQGLCESDFVIRSAGRKEVPQLLAASDINLFFIRQSYSKIASSPTKLGEILAMGLPVICNTRVGDVEAIVKQTESGIAIDEINDNGYKQVIDAIPSLLQKQPESIRQNAMGYYKLENAIARYASVYAGLLSAVSEPRSIHV